MDFGLLVKQTLLFPKNFILGRISIRPTSLDEIQQGEGTVVEVNKTKIAAFRDSSGKLATLSPICTHAGCVVEWNSNDKTWDCPCHGARFNSDGTVKNGPAKKALGKIEITHTN